MKIYFKKDLAQEVEKLRALKDTHDEINDLNRIDNAIKNFNSVDGIYQARLLNQELREKYTEISLMLSIAEGMPKRMMSYQSGNQSDNYIPVEIKCLEQDYYGISAKLLKDLNKIYDIKDFIDYVD